MTYLRGVAGLVVLVTVLNGSTSVVAQEAAPPDQYRFRNVSISGATADEPVLPEFSSQHARNYLDLGAELWASQKRCVSCHTHGIYALVRPSLTDVWGPPSSAVRTFLADQRRSIEEEEQYTGSTPAQLAYIAGGLAAWDAEFDESTSPETDAALRTVLRMQDADGSIRVRDRWPPLNADTWHATVMTAIAAATAPGWLEQIENDPIRQQVDSLRAYLQRTPPRNDHQGLLLLWASTRIPDLLDDARREELVNMIWSQQRADGGWSIRTFATLETWGGGARAERLVAEPDYSDPPSDGYQTGLALIVLRDAGIPADDPRIQRGVEWLLTHQRATGRWWTRSLNTESRFHYITYSGSAYAALALAKCDALPVVVD